MPKFKIKNRKKRKYIKRNSPDSIISLSKSPWIKLMPYFVMAIGLLATMATTPAWHIQPIQSIEPIQSPVLQIQPIQLIKPIQPIDFTLTRPTVSFDGILRMLHEIALFLDILVMHAQKQTALALNLIVNMSIQGLSSLMEIMAVFASGTEFLITVLGKGIATILQAVVHTITIVVTTVWHVLTEVMKALIAFIEFSITTIGNALTVAITKTIEGLNAAWYFLMTPVRALVAYYIKIKPYLDFIGNNIKDSTMFLIESMSLVMGGMTK